MQKWSWRYYLALVLAIFGILLLAYFIFIEPSFNDWSFNFNPDLSAKFGGFIGGFIGSLFSLAGIFLLFETLIRQKMAFEKQQFEVKFFELLKIYRDNIQEMEHKPFGKKEIYGRRVFVELRKQFGEIYDKIKKIAQEGNYQIDNKDTINISYIIFFIGIGETSNQILEKYLEKYKRYHGDLIDEIIQIFSFEDSSEHKFDGHQSRLSHHYRHLFQSIAFIDKAKYLTENEKYFYIKTFRAQMSTHELAMFFINSLSDFGKAWSDNTPSLMMKYKLIKNMPLRLVFDINPRDYYPMEYEEDERSQLPTATEFRTKQHNFIE